MMFPHFCRTLILSVLAILTACDHGKDNGLTATENVLSTENDSDHPGFIIANAKGVLGSVGTDEVSAKNNERPKMGVTFSYNFSMEKHETTCGDFKQIMEKEFDNDLHPSCENDSLPITDITYYDAILYANAKSRASHYDTVYTYSKRNFDSEGHCIKMEGLNFLPKKKGFRLPLESEWTLVASHGWNANNSWTADNSGGQTHKVCQNKQNNLGFCDLEGNVREWVNDWMGFFKEDTIANYAGTSSGNSLGERVVKGGYYNSVSSSLQPYNRNDTYVVTGATHTNYVGFRLAIGQITNPTWLNNNGSISKDRVTIISNAATIRKHFGTYNAKMIFRNELSETLEFLDYSNGKISSLSIPNTIPTYHPEISPDGKYVAFCTTIEGIAEKSEIYVKGLSEKDSTLIKLNVESAAIPRWRIIENDTVITYVSSAGSNNSESFLTDAATWQVSFSQGNFGKPQKLFDGAYHGGVTDDNKFAVTGSTLLRARVVESKNSVKDTIWYNEEQACNVSLAKDGSKRTLFLDFASQAGKDFAEESYSVHKRLFIADSTGKLIQSIKAPKGFTFDHTEWSYGNFVIATLCDNRGNHKKIVLIDLSNENIIELAEASDLWHPSLWASQDNSKIDSEIDLDSAGIYMGPDDSWASVLMRYNMELLWKFYDTLNVAILGSSRPLDALSPSLLSDDLFAVNFAHTPNSIYATKDFLDKYLFTHAFNLKYIVMSLDIDFWHVTNNNLGGNFFLTYAPNYPGYNYDANHEYWKNGVPEGLLNATENGLKVEDEYRYLDDRGRFIGSPCLSWGGDAAVDMDSTINDNHPEYINDSFDVLEYIIRKAADRDIYVIGIIFPLSPHYKETGAFGRYGLRRSMAKDVIQRLKEVHEIFPNFILMDENKMGNHDYPDEMALDYDHLCEEGGKKITARIDSLLHTLK